MSYVLCTIHVTVIDEVILINKSCTDGEKCYIRIHDCYRSSETNSIPASNQKTKRYAKLSPREIKHLASYRLPNVYFTNRRSASVFRFAIQGQHLRKCLHVSSYLRCNREYNFKMLCSKVYFYVQRGIITFPCVSTHACLLLERSGTVPELWQNAKSPALCQNLALCQINSQQNASMSQVV